MDSTQNEFLAMTELIKNCHSGPTAFAGAGFDPESRTCVIHPET